MYNVSSLSSFLRPVLQKRTVPNRICYDTGLVLFGNLMNRRHNVWRISSLKLIQKNRSPLWKNYYLIYKCIRIAARRCGLSGGRDLRLSRDWPREKNHFSGPSLIRTELTLNSRKILSFALYRGKIRPLLQIQSFINKNRFRQGQQSRQNQSELLSDRK